MSGDPSPSRAATSSGAGGPTEFAELNAVLHGLADEVGEILGDTLVGVYLQGSFALGAGDEHSDGDFVVAVERSLTAVQERGIRALHDAIPTRSGHWTKHIEGSYAPIADLREAGAIGRDWLFVDHGWREMDWSPHCNTEVARWTLREHGIAIGGPPPSDLVAVVPAAALQARMGKDVVTCLVDIQSWASLELAWTQRYIVTTLCRIAFTATHGTVASKRAAIEWAIDFVDARWVPLLEQVLADRSLGFDADARPRPGSLEETFEFNDMVVSWVRGSSPSMW